MKSQNNKLARRSRTDQSSVSTKARGIHASGTTYTILRQTTEIRDKLRSLAVKCHCEATTAEKRAIKMRMRVLGRIRPGAGSSSRPRGLLGTTKIPAINSAGTFAGNNAIISRGGPK
jgi:hypothetical protein